MTDRDIAAELVTYLAENGEDTAMGAARAIQARTSDVLQVVRTDKRFSGPLAGEHGRLYYRLAPEALHRRTAFLSRSRPVTIRAGTDCARLYDALADGEWHSSSELNGLRMTVHSRISDLRLKHGCAVETMHDPQQERARAYLYRLTGAPLTGGETMPAVSFPVSGDRASSLAENANARVSWAGREGSGSPLTLFRTEAA